MRSQFLVFQSGKGWITSHNDIYASFVAYEEYDGASWVEAFQVLGKKHEFKSHTRSDTGPRI